MIKKQTFEVMERIKQYYPQFEVSQTKLDAWHAVLSPYEFDNIVTNLEKHATRSNYPPTVADLLGAQNIDTAGPVVPGVDETREYLRNLSKETPTNPDFVEKEKKKIREILNIIRGI